MKLGAEPKKVAMLGGLLLAAGVVFYIEEFSGNSGSNETPRPVATAAPTTAAPAPVAATRTPVPGVPRDDHRRSRNMAVAEFSIRQGQEPGEEKPDPSTIDPTLRLDLLAKVQQVDAPASLRNIFQYGAAPPPPEKVIPLPPSPGRIAISGPPRPQPPPGPPPAPPVPTAPAMTFKYYGYKVSRANGRKEAFLLDGEEIIIAGENDSMKAGRYKIVRIGVSSITIEDTQFKASQTLQLQPDAAV